MIVRIAALASASSAGFTDDDYTLALVGSPAGVTLATHSAGGYSLAINRQSASLPSLQAVQLKLTLKTDTDTESGTGYLAIQADTGSSTRALGPLDCGAPNSEAVSATGTAGCYSIGAEGTTRYRVGINLADETGELKITEEDSAPNNNAIVVTEGTDTGFGITFTRVPSGDLSTQTASLPVDISRLVSITNASSGLTATDFSGQVRIDYDGGVDGLTDLTEMSNVKGFPGATVATSTGLVLNFNRATGAGNAKDANTLYFGINDDDLLEGDETFDLVIDPAGLTGGLVATVGGKPFKILAKRTISVTIKSDDNMTMTGRTITPITEAGGDSSQTYVQGKYEITFTGAELANPFTEELYFADQDDTFLPSSRIGFVAAESTTGVTFNASGPSYTLPANTSPMKMVFTLDLASTTNNDGEQSRIYSEIDVPTAWNAPGFTVSIPEPAISTLTQDVEIVDADINAIKVYFGAAADVDANSGAGQATGSWGGGENVYVPADRKTLYQHQLGTNVKQCGIVRLNRDWDSANPLTVNLVVTGGNLGIVAGSSEPAAATSAAVQFTNADATNNDVGFCVKLTTTAGGGTAEGFLTSTITATPTLTYSGGTHDASLISTKADALTHIRLDDDNNFTIAAPTTQISGISQNDGTTKNFNVYQTEEGGNLDLTLASGVAVTAPAGENYGLQVGIARSGGDVPSPQAIGFGRDYKTNPRFTATSLAPGAKVSVPFTSNDNFINGNRYHVFSTLVINTAKRGASTTASSVSRHDDQGQYIVEIQDNDSANLAPSLTNAYPTARTSGATAAERATLKFSGGAKVPENDSGGLPFYISLQRAHRANDLHGPTAPLKIEIEPVGTIPAGFTGADYEIVLPRATGGVSVSYDDSGSGKATINVSRNNPGAADPTSATSIPLSLILKEDTDIEGAGVVNFGVTDLGHLECTALNEPDTVEQGCYHVGTVSHGGTRAPFQLAMDLVDETGELTITEGDSAPNDNAIEVTEGTDNGFAITFTRQQPSGDLASTAVALPVDISRMVSITGAGGSSGITADDFVTNLQIDYDGGVDNLATLTRMTNIKGFPGGVSTSTGVVLNFNQGGGASNADDANTLFFGITDDNLVEADETFNLVIDPAGTPLLATIAGKPFKISTKREITVTIKSDDEMTVTGRTITPITEFGGPPLNQAYQQGKYEITFTGAELPSILTGNTIRFFDQAGVALPSARVAVVRGAGETTTGVSYSTSTGRYTLPANTSPIKIVFTLALASPSASDGVQSRVYTDIGVPEDWTTTGFTTESTTSGISTVRQDVTLIDADINAIQVYFGGSEAVGTAVGSWGGGQAVYIPADKKTLYHQQPSTNVKQCGVVVLTRIWDQQRPLTVNLAVTGGNLAIVAGDNEPAALTSTSVQIANATKEAIFCVKLTSSAGDGTPEGFRTMTITATPTRTRGGGQHPASSIALTPDSLTYYRMDDDNNFTVAEPSTTVSAKYRVQSGGSFTGVVATKDFKTYQIAEGGDLSVTLTGGGSVTAPTGESYGLQFGTSGSTGGVDLPQPQALSSGNDYNLSPTVTVPTVAPSAAVAVTGFAAANDSFINGTRYARIGALRVTTQNRGVGTTATSLSDHSDQTPRFIQITDDDSANIAAGLGLQSGYPSAKTSGATAAERATLDLGSGAKVAESASATLDFHFELQRAHRTEAIGDEAPLTITFGPEGSVPAGFTGADYSIAVNGAPAGVSYEYDPAGNGELTVEVLRSDLSSDSTTSVTSIPLKLTLKPDDDVEGGGVVTFGIKGLGHLQCSTLVQPATSEAGCYHVGAVSFNGARAPFQLSMDLVDEGGALKIEETDDNTDGLIEVTESSATNNGFGITFTRQPEDGLTDRAGGYTANISPYVSVEDVAETLIARDFKSPLKIDYNGGTDVLADLTGVNINSIKGFKGATATSGLLLKFAETGGASAGASANTLFFAIEDDNLVEPDEAFTVVIDPGTGVATIPLGVADTNAKITAKTEIVVTIKSDDAVTVSGDTTTAIREGSTSAAMQKGRYKLDFTGAAYATPQTLNVAFTQTKDGGDATTLTTGSGAQVSLASGTTSGVTLSSGGVLTLPANVADIDVVFDVGLTRTGNNSDDGVTAVQMSLQAPSLGTSADSSLDSSTVSGMYLADIDVVDTDLQTYEVKFEVNGSDVASVQENGFTDTAVKIHLAPVGTGSGLPAGTADLDNTASGVQALVFQLTLTKNGEAYTGDSFNASGQADSTWNATKGRYEWDLTIDGNDTAETNGKFIASVQTKKDWSSADLAHLTGGTYRPISHAATESDRFTVYDDDNAIAFNAALPASVDAGTEEGTDGALVKVNSHFLTNTDTLALGATADTEVDYIISFAVSSPDGADPMEQGNGKDYTTAIASGSVADRTRQGNFKLKSDGTIGAATLLNVGRANDNIIEDTEGLRITLTGVEPANRGLKVATGIDNNQRGTTGDTRIFLFEDATADGVSLLTLSANAPQAADFSASSDARTDAEKEIADVAEGVDVPVYVHLSKPTEKEQVFTLSSTAAKEEYDFGGIDTDSQSTRITIPARAAGTQVGTIDITLAQDDDAEGTDTYPFALSAPSDPDFPVKSDSSSIDIKTVDETGELIITNTNVEIAEGEATLELTIRRQGELTLPSSGQKTLGAQLNFAFGNPADATLPRATKGTDYTEDTASKTILFTQVGNNQYQEKTVQLTLNVFNGADGTGDGIEGPEYFTVKIASATRPTTGGASVEGTAPDATALKIGNTNTVPVQIVDSEKAIVSFATDSVTFTEGQDNAVVVLNVSETRRLNRISLDLAVSAATDRDESLRATVGDDYTTIDAARSETEEDKIITVTIPASRNVAKAAKVNVPISLIDDAIIETPQEYFKVSLPSTLPTGFDFDKDDDDNIINNEVEIAITDDDNKANFPAPPVGEEAQTIAVNEPDNGEAPVADTVLSIPVEVGLASATRSRIHYALVTDSAKLTTLGLGEATTPLATANSDFTLPATTSVLLPANQVRAQISVNIKHDTDWEPTEYFALELINTPSGVAVGDNQYIIVRIQDNDRIELLVTNPTTAVEQEDDGAGTVTARPVNGKIVITLPTRLPANYRVEVKPYPTNNDRFTMSPAFVQWRRGETGDKTIRVITSTGEISSSDARFTVGEVDANGIYNDVVDIVAGSGTSIADQTEATDLQRQFNLNYTDSDVFAPLISELRSSTGVEATVDPNGKRVTIPESFIPRGDGLFVITLAAPNLEPATAGNAFATELAKSGDDGGQVNFAAVVNDGSATLGYNRLTTGSGATAALKQGVSIFSGKANGDEAFGFWKNAGGSGQVGGGSTVQILMPNRSYWRDNDTIEGNREFTITLTPKAYARTDALYTTASAGTPLSGEVETQVKVAKSTTWTFVIIDDDINPPRIKDRAQVSFQHYTLFEKSTVERANFAAVPTTGRWVDGLPTEIEKGSRLWIRLKSSLAFGEHLTVANPTDTQRIKFAIAPAGGNSFLSTTLGGIEWGYKRNPAAIPPEAQNNQFSVPQEINIPLSTDNAGNKLVTGRQTGHARLQFETDIATAVPTESALQSNAVTFRQPAPNSVTLLDPSDAAFNPTFEPTADLYEVIPEPRADNYGAGRLVALTRGSKLGKDQTATVTFATDKGFLRVIEPTGLDDDLITIAKGDGLTYTVTFKKNLAVPSSGAIPDEAQPLFSYEFVQRENSENKADPDNVSGTPVVTVTVEVGGSRAVYPVPVVDSENPVFGWVSQAQGGKIFESDIETLFPNFSIGRTTAAQTTVTLRLEAKPDPSNPNRGVAGIHAVLTAGGWALGAPTSESKIPYSKEIVIAAGATGTIGRGSSAGELNIPITNDAITSPGGSYTLLFKAPVLKTGSTKPANTNLSEDFTITVYDDDRLYSFLKPNARGDDLTTDGVGRWGSALSDETALNPTLKTQIDGLLEVEALASHEGAVNGKIYGYLEGVLHRVNLYVADGGIPSGGNFSTTDLFTSDLWQGTARAAGRFGSGEIAECDVFAKNSDRHDIARDGFRVHASDDATGTVGGDNDVPSDHLPYRVVGRGANDSFAVECAGKQYHLRPADGQPKVLYRLNDDARVYYQFTQTGSNTPVPVTGTNSRILTYTERAGDFDGPLGTNPLPTRLPNPSGEGPFYKVEIKLVDDKPVGYPLTVAFKGQGAPEGEVRDYPNSLNEAFGYEPPTRFRFLWIRSATEPTSELATPVPIHSPVRNTLIKEDVGRYDNFVDSPFHLPAGTTEQTPTSRGARGSGSDPAYKNDLYLVVARDLSSESGFRIFNNIKVIPTRSRVGNTQFSSDSTHGTGATVTLETERRLVENLQVAWSDDTTTLLADDSPFVENLAAEGTGLRPTLEFSGMPIKAAAGVEAVAFSFCLRLGNPDEIEIDRDHADNLGFLLTEAHIAAAAATASAPIQVAEAASARACIVAGSGQGPGAWWSTQTRVSDNSAGTVIETTAGSEAHQMGKLVFQLKDDGVANTSVTFGDGETLDVRDGAAADQTLTRPTDSWLPFASDAGWKGKNVGVTLLPYTGDGNFLTGLGLTVPPLRIPVLEDDVVVNFNADALADGGPQLTLDAFNAGYGGDDWTQEDFDASPYSDLHGIIEETGVVQLGQLMQLANFVDRGGAPDATTNISPFSALITSTVADANILQRISNALTANTGGITITPPTGTPAPTTAAAISGIESAPYVETVTDTAIVAPIPAVTAYNDTVFTAPSTPRTIGVTIPRPTLEGITFEGEGFGEAFTINVIDPNAPTFSANKGGASTEVQRDPTAEGNGPADFDINENDAGTDYYPEAKLNLVGDDRLIGGQNIIFDPLHSGADDANRHPDQTASKSDYTFNGSSQFSRFWIKGANSGTQYGFDFTADTTNNIIQSGPMNARVVEDAVFEDTEVIIASYEPAGAYKGYIGVPLMEGGEVLTDANGKARRGMTFRMFITDDEALTFRFVGDAPAKQTITEGVPLPRGNQPSVVFTCSSPSGDNASPDTSAGEDANTCTSIETAAATGAKLTMSQPAGDYYALAAGDTEAEAGATTMTVPTGEITGNSATVVFNIQKPSNTLVEDFPSDGETTPSYIQDLTLTLSALDDADGGARTSLAATTPTTHASTRLFALKDEEENQTYDFAGRQKDLGTKNEGEAVYTPRIRITNSKETDKAITPEVRIVDSGDNVLAGWDWQELAGLTIDAGENSATADAAIVIAADDTLQANPTDKTYSIKLRDNTDATKTFARIPRGAATDPSFILKDIDKARASLKVSRVSAGSIDVATATALANSAYGSSALGAADTESGFGFLFRLRIADGETFTDAGVSNEDGTIKTLDGDLNFRVNFARNDGVGSYVTQSDFGAPTLASPASDGTIAWHRSNVRLEGTLKQGKSELLFFLPVADDNAVEDIENMTATLTLNKGRVGGAGSAAKWPKLDVAKNGHDRVTLRIDSDDKAQIQFTAAAADLLAVENKGDPLGNSDKSDDSARKISLTLPADNVFLKQPNGSGATAYNLHFAYKLEPVTSTGASNDDLKGGNPNLRDGNILYTSLDGQGMGYLGTATSGDRGAFYNVGDRGNQRNVPVAWANASDGFEFTENFNLTLVGLYLADETGKTARVSDELDLDEHAGYQADDPTTTGTNEASTIDQLYATSLWGGDITVATADNSQPASGSPRTITTYEDDVIPIFLRDRDYRDGRRRPRITLSADKDIVEETGTAAERTITYSLKPDTPFFAEQTYTMVLATRNEAAGLSPKSAQFPADVVAVIDDPDNPGTEIESSAASNLTFTFAKGSIAAQTLKLRFKDRTALTTCRPRAIRASLSPRPALIDEVTATDNGYDYETPVDPVRDAFIQYLGKESLAWSSAPRTKTTLTTADGDYPQYNPLILTNTVCADKFVQSDGNDYLSNALNNPEIPTSGLSATVNSDLTVVHRSVADPNNAYQARAILRIRLDGNQGLNGGKRTAIYNSFSVVAESHLRTPVHALETKTNQYYAVVLNFPSSVVKIKTTSEDAVGKRFKVDLIGPYQSTFSHPWFKARYPVVPTNTAGTAITLSNSNTGTNLPDGVLTRTYDLAVARSVSGRFHRYNPDDGVISNFALSGESLNLVRGEAWEGVFDEQPFLASGASYVSGNTGANTQDAAVSHTVRVSLKAGHGLTAEQVAQVFQGPDIITGFSHFSPARQSDIVKSATHQAQASRTDNTISFATHELPKFMEGKTLVVEVLGPYALSNSPGRTPESTEFTGATGTGTGSVLQSFEINITAAPVTGTLKKADGTAIADGSTVNFDYSENMTFQFDETADAAGVGHVLRIKLDSSIDDGDSDDATIQGLTATQRKAIWDLTPIDDSGSTDGSENYNVARNNNFVGVRLYEDDAIIFPYKDVPVVDKTFTIELLGAYDTGTNDVNPPTTLENSAGYGGAVVLQTFKAKIGKTPQSAKLQTDDATPADIAEGSTIEVAHDDLTQTFNFVDIANNAFTHFVRVTLDPSVDDGDGDPTTVQEADEHPANQFVYDRWLKNHLDGWYG